jgi:hypothetical protein
MIPRKPPIFIGSSSEGLEVARACEVQLQDCAEITLWSDGVFGLGSGTLESLIKALDIFEFALLVVTADDLVVKRGRDYLTARDNIIFELGLFMGRLGPQRTFFLCSEDITLPSDLAGVTKIKFSKREDGNLISAVSPSCTLVRNAIRQLITQSVSEQEPRSSIDNTKVKNHQDVKTDNIPSGDYDFVPISSINKVQKAKNRIRLHKDSLLSAFQNNPATNKVVEGVNLSIGDRFPIPESTWVEVLNPNGVRTVNGIHRCGETCVVSDSGEIEIVGFHPDPDISLALVRYCPKDECAGSECGEGTLFLCPV